MSEYYVWKSRARSWRGGLVRAELRPFRRDWYRVIDQGGCEPFGHLLPSRLEFDVVGAGGGMPDLIWSANLEPWSKRLLDLFAQMGCAYEAVPAILYDRRTKAVLRGDYAYVHVMNCIGATDFELTSGEIGVGADGRRYLRKISRLVLRPEVASSQIPAFRLEEARSLVIVHDSFRVAHEEMGLQGSTFVPVDQYSEVDPWIRS